LVLCVDSSVVKGGRSTSRGKQAGCWSPRKKKGELRATDFKNRLIRGGRGGKKSKVRRKVSSKNRKVRNCFQNRKNGGGEKGLDPRIFVEDLRVY